MAYKTKTGLWRTHITINGKRKYISAKTEAELEAKKAAALYEEKKGLYADDKGITVGAWAQEWLQAYKSGVSPATLHGYKNIIKNHIQPILHIRLKDLSKSDIQKCINQASGHYDIQRRIKLTLNQMLETAIDDGLVYRNVARSITVKRPIAEKRARALTQQEKEIIPKLDFESKEKAYIYLLWYAGLRPEEARALQVSDIDFLRGEISVSKALSYDGNKPNLKTPKTQSGIRTIPILDPLREVLQEYIPTVSGMYLLTDTRGNIMSKTAYRRFWSKIYNKINTALGGTDTIKATDLTPYAFRHEYATLLYYSGIDIKEAARLMGHTDTRLILDTYAELDASRSSSSSKLNDFIKTAY